MTRSCTVCRQSFEVSPDDLAFLDTISPTFAGKKHAIPPPTLCPDCRMQRRLTFRNERHFYHRNADDTNASVVSIYSPDKPVKVYSQEGWWSDTWNAADTGRDYDFSKPFFEQFAALWKDVPMIALWNIDADNAVYNNCSSHMKDSYMNACSDHDRNVMYSYVVEFSNDVADSAFTHKSELCYECLGCAQAFQCTFSQMLDNCSDCHFCSDLVGCKRCFGCHGLRHKEYCIFNKRVSPQEWKEKVDSAVFTPRFIEESRAASRTIELTVPKLCIKQVQCEQCRGDHLYQCKNAVDCFDVVRGENLRRVVYAPWDIRNARDVYAFAQSEWVYELIGSTHANTVGFILNTSNGLSNSYYCVLCVNGSSDLFGCVGLKHAKYCILNKQYTKEEYERLAAKIIERMQAAGEWGEYFPASISHFGYNETAAQDMFPLEKDEALKKGFRWSDAEQPPPQVEKIIPASNLPEAIGDIPDDIVNWAVKCEATGRPFRIVKQELEFYRRMGLPVPRLHPDERHRRRLTLRNPRKLWKRTCARCRKDIDTSYAPDRPEKVYCEECYLKEVY